MIIEIPTGVANIIILDGIAFLLGLMVKSGMLKFSYEYQFLTDKETARHFNHRIRLPFTPLGFPLFSNTLIAL
jgi:hypothetical protein